MASLVEGAVCRMWIVQLNRQMILDLALIPPPPAPPPSCIAVYVVSGLPDPVIAVEDMRVECDLEHLRQEEILIDNGQFGRALVWLFGRRKEGAPLPGAEWGPDFQRDRGSLHSLSHLLLLTGM